MRSVKSVIGILMLSVLFMVFIYGTREAAQSAEEENHCFTCHTNARKLIQITREIAEANKDKPGASTETEGEG